MSESVRPHLLESSLGCEFLAKYRDVISAVHLDIIEMDDVIEQIFIAMLAGGHVLLEGAPGVGKTLLLTTFARTIDATCKRLQCTPETYPGDMYYSFGGMDEHEEERGKKITEARLTRGPLFTQILIVDEINRAPSRVHAPLLEPLQEHTITIEGVCHDLGDFYFMIATQNPVETSESTNRLFEALRERITLLCHVPTAGLALLRKVAVHDSRPKDIPSVLDVAEIVAVQNAIFEQYVLGHTAENDPVVGYVARLITALQDHPVTQWGPGTRAAMDLMKAGAVHAFLHGRTSIGFENIKAIARPALRFKFERKVRESRALRITENDQLIEDMLRSVPLVQDS